MTQRLEAAPKVCTQNEWQQSLYGWSQLHDVYFYLFPRPGCVHWSVIMVAPVSRWWWSYKAHRNSSPTFPVPMMWDTSFATHSQHVYFSEAGTNEQGQVTSNYNYELDTGYEGVQNATVLWLSNLLMRFLRKDIRVGGVLGTCFYYQLTTSWFHHARTVFPSVDRAYLCEFHNKG
jgi:hypothetical protein